MSTMDPTAIETRPPADGRTAGKTQAALLVAGSCMPVLGAVLLAPVLPTLNQVFADTAGVAILVPLVLTLPALFVALFSPLAGYVADRMGRKQLLIYAMLAYALFGTAPLWLDSLGAIAFSRVGVGIAEAAIMTCCTTLITDYYSGQQRNKYLGLQTMVSALAATAFFALGGALGSISWRTPFWLYAVSAVLVIPMVLKLWEPAKVAPTTTDETAGAVAADWCPGRCDVVRWDRVLRADRPPAVCHHRFGRDGYWAHRRCRCDRLTGHCSRRHLLPIPCQARHPETAHRRFRTGRRRALPGLVGRERAAGDRGRRYRQCRYRSAVADTPDVGGQRPGLRPAGTRYRHLDRDAVHRAVPYADCPWRSCCWPGEPQPCTWGVGHGLRACLGGDPGPGAAVGPDQPVKLPAAG